MAQLDGLQHGASHISEEELVFHYYGEAENAAEIDLHLTLCGECRTAYAAFKSDMIAIENLPVPVRGPEYGHEVWRALVRKDASIAADKRPWWRRWFVPQRMAAAGVLAGLVLFAFLAGRFTKPNAPVEQATSERVVRERLLAAALGEHLEASERTLMAISNLSGGEKIDMTLEQARAESLLDGNRLYRQTAQLNGQQSLANVLGDLERVLLEVAHGPTEMSKEQLNALRARMDEQGLLFKVRVLELRLQELDNRPLHTPAPKNSKG